MTRYYFNIRYGERVFDDEEGSEHATQDAAWHEATQACGEMLRTWMAEYEMARNGGWK
jgi:hypothetical protein